MKVEAKLASGAVERFAFPDYNRFQISETQNTFIVQPFIRTVFPETVRTPSNVFLLSGSTMVPVKLPFLRWNEPICWPA